MKPKHLFITSGYPPERGFFAHRAVKCLEPYLDTKVVYLCAMRPGRIRPIEYSFDEVDVIKIPIIIPPFEMVPPAVLWGTAASSLHSIYKYIDWADFVEAGNVFPTGLLALRLMRIAQMKSKPFTVDAIGTDVMVILNEFYNKGHPVLEEISEGCDAYLSNSKHMSCMLEKFTKKKDGIFTAYRGVDFRMFSPEGPIDNILENTGGVKFLYLGGFGYRYFSSRLDSNEVKGGKYLLDAWSKVEKQQREVHLILGGAGADSKYIEAWRDGLAHPERVTIIPGGFVKPERVPGFMRGVDCLLITSLSEGLPNVANEAQACGIPVISTDVGGVKETLVDGETGFLVKSRDSDGIADAICRMASDRGGLKRMGEAGRRRMLALFPWGGYSKEAIKAYSHAYRVKSLLFPLVTRDQTE